MKRGRFAPTPSGQLHLGNARTALLAWLDMRSQGGTIVLRMENIDKHRSRAEYAGSIMEDLRWLGLDWDEGPDIGGPHAPYTQSEREQLYADALSKLQASGHLYPCYCSRAELITLANAPHGLASEGPVYPGTCLKLNEAERIERERHKRPSLRFRLPERAGHSFNDAIAGPQHFVRGGDFVIVRADGMYGYQLAVVVDDAAMGITHVMRGSDLLDSTPRQLALYEALGVPSPSFAHVPLLLDADGSRLAKRHSGLSLSRLRASRIPAERIVGALAYLSGLIDRLQTIKPHELIPSFTLSGIPREPARLDDKVMKFLAC